MSTIRIIVAGGRKFANYELLAAKMDAFTKDLDFTDLEIVSGGARGADLLGERWALENEVPVMRFAAEWDRLGKSAGFRRNDQMREYATHLVAFWDGKSKGTRHMIALAARHRLKVRVVRY